MKCVVIILAIWSLLSLKEDFQISGNYKLEYDAVNLKNNDCIITFDKANYIKSSSNDIIHGAITRNSSNKFVRLYDFVSHANGYIEFEEKNTDTLEFKTRHKRNFNRIFSTGKLIRMK